MGRKKDYRRWNYEDETEISMEEQLSLEDHDYDHGRDTPTSTTTFSQPTNVTLTASHHIHRKKGHQNMRIKEKVRYPSGNTHTLLATSSLFPVSSKCKCTKILNEL